MNTPKINIIRQPFIFFLAAGILILCFSQCKLQDKFDYVPNPPNPYLKMSAWEFIQQRADIMSIMKQAIIRADMQTLYSDTKNYTYILPRNNAWQKYLKNKGLESIDHIPVLDLQKILQYHLVDAKVNFSDPALREANNPVAYNTLSGEQIYLSHNTNYQGLINQGTKMTWTIITSNLEATNGTVHITDDVVFLSK